MATIINTVLSKFNSRLGANFMSMGLFQLANAALPLINFPYLSRVCGKEALGLVYFSQGLVAFLVIVIECGFNFSATRAIAVAGDDKVKIGAEIGRVLQVKMVILPFLAIFWGGLVWLVPALRAQALLHILSFSVVLGYGFMPVWYYQGSENIKLLAGLNFLAKLTFTGLIFGLITKVYDYHYITLYQTASSAVVTLIGFWLIIYRYKVTISFTSLDDTFGTIKTNLSLMGASFLTNITQNAPIAIVGFLLPSMLGSYNVVERIIWPIRQLLDAGQKVIFPHICKLITAKTTGLILIFKKYSVGFGLFFGAGSIVLVVIAKYIVGYFVGQEASGTIISLLREASIIPVLVALGITGNSLGLAAGQNHTYLRNTAIMGIALIILCIVGTYYFGPTGTIIAIAVAEFIGMGLGLRLGYSIASRADNK